VTFRLRLSNRSDSDVTDVLFPWLGGWTGLGGKGKDFMVLGGVRSIDPHAFPKNKGTTFIRFHSASFWHYPVILYCPWVDLSGPGGGLSYISYMEGPRNLGFMLENIAGYERGLRMGFWVDPLHAAQTWRELGVTSNRNIGSRRRLARHGR